MVTVTTGPKPKGQQQQQQQQAKKKFKLKHLFRKNKYAKFQNNNEEAELVSSDISCDPPDSGRSIEVLDFQDFQEQELVAECSNNDSGVQTHDLSEPEPSTWTEQSHSHSHSHSKSKKRVRFWRYNKDDALLEDDITLEDVGVGECSHHSDELQEPGTEGPKKKKSNKKRAKEAGLTTWKYCKRGWKYMKAGLVYYANGVSTLNIANMGGIFRPNTQSTYTDYTQYDQYDQYGNKKRQKTRTDYTKYDDFCKNRGN